MFLCFCKFGFNNLLSWKELFKLNLKLKNLVEDSETNDGTMEKPYYMSDNLKKILGKENKL